MHNIVFVVTNTFSRSCKYSIPLVERNHGDITSAIWGMKTEDVCVVFLFQKATLTGGRYKNRKYHL